MLKRVRERELGIGRAEFRRRNARARFSSYRLEQQHDTHDPDAANLKLSFLRRRSKIVEIVAAGDVVFALTLSGVCAAFCGSRRIAFLNTMPDEVIRSLFYNKANRSLITVSVYRDDNFSSLKCRTTPIEYIRRGQPDAGFALFESECLKWPGFVEFDDVNGKVLTYSVLDKAYRVWDMTNYEELYVMREPEIAEIKISPGIMLVIYNRVADQLPASRRAPRCFFCDHCAATGEFILLTELVNFGAARMMPSKHRVRDATTLDEQRLFVQCGAELNASLWGRRRAAERRAHRRRRGAARRGRHGNELRGARRPRLLPQGRALRPALDVPQAAPALGGRAADHALDPDVARRAAGDGGGAGGVDRGREGGAEGQGLLLLCALLLLFFFPPSQCAS